MGAQLPAADFMAATTTATYPRPSTWGAGPQVRQGYISRGAKCSASDATGEDPRLESDSTIATGATPTTTAYSLSRRGVGAPTSGVPRTSSLTPQLTSHETGRPSGTARLAYWCKLFRIAVKTCFKQ